MKTPSPIKYLLPSVLAAGAILAALPSQAALIHRYSFNEATGPDVIDSIQGSNGVARVRSTSGGVVPTFNGSSVTLDGVGGYIDLPDGLITGPNLTNVSFEIWLTWTAGGNWTRILDFGNNSTGEDPDGTVGTGNGNNYLFIAATATGTPPRFAITPQSNGQENPIMTGTTALTQGVEAYLVVTYGPSGASMFLDGQAVGSAAYNTPLSAIQDTNNWLGRSNWNDPYFGGSFNEFRIHDTRLSQLQVLAAKAAGPDTVNYTPENPSSITLIGQDIMTVGTSQTPSIDASFPTYGQVTVGAGDVTLSSSATNIVRISTANNIVAVAQGTATVTATLGGKTSSITITVNPPIVFTALRNRYSFNEGAGATTVTDSVGGKNGTVVPPTTNTVAPVVISNGMANFPGGAVATAGYIDLPQYMVSTGFTNFTVEMWITWNGPANGNTWARVFDFGDSTKGHDPHATGNGTTYITFTVRRSGGGARNEFRATGDFGTTYVSTFNDQPASPGFPVGKETHVVSTFAPSIGYSALWIDGVPVSIASTPSVTLGAGLPPHLFQFNETVWDNNMWLGIGQYGDPPFNGSINELRLYEGVLGELKIALDRKAGPNTLPVADPGALQQISLQTPALYVGNPNSTQLTLLGDYQNATGLEITAFDGVKYESADTNIFTVSSTGALRPQAVGTANLIATYKTFSATSAVSVLAPVALHVPATSRVENSTGFTLSLFADFGGDLTNVNVTAFNGVTRTSSNTNQLAIANNGSVSFVGGASSPTVTSTYGGLTDTSAVTITPLPPRTLIHRYSFDGAKDSTVVTDSVGGANGNVVNIQAGSAFYNNFSGTGQYIMGPGPFQEPPTTNSYINLPNTLISTLSNVTVEGWFTWFGGADNQRLWDFGMSSSPDGFGGYVEDIVVNPGRSYFFMSPQTGRPRFAMKQGTGNENPSLQAPTGMGITASNLAQVAIVYDQPNGVARLYVNGQRVNTATATLALSVVDDRNNWLGRSNWQDPYYNGSVDEFRIYDGASSDAQIAADYAAGPDSLAVVRPTVTFTTTGGGGVGGQLKVSWPVSAGSYTLKSSSSLGAGATWSAAGTPSVEGDNNVVTVTITGDGSMFFRLEKN